jgi:protease II
MAASDGRSESWTMGGINRRDLFMAAGSLFAALLARRAARAAAASIPPAPVARVEVVKDTYFGETLPDPYRWMENDQDPAWLPFLQGQNAHARAVLDTIPRRDRLLKRIGQLSGDAALTRVAMRAGGRLFFEQRPAGADNFKLFVRENGTTRVLIDPTRLSDTHGHMSLDWWEPSPNGAHLVYGLSKDGSEDSVLHVLNVADGADLPERIPNTESAQPAWLDDGSGFFYNQLTGTVDTPERYLDSRARFHLLGSDPAEDPIIMQRGRDASVSYERIQLPLVQTFLGADYALLLLADVRSEFRVFIAPVAAAAANQARWIAVADFDDEITDVVIDSDTLHALSCNPSEPGALFSFTGWLTPGDIWSVDAQDAVAATGLTPSPPIDVSGYEAHRLYATARDGTRIPYTIIHRKGLKRDGRSPAWISAYGSYGLVGYSPSFAGRTLALVDAGCIVGYASVRGGGEYGRDWHKAGQLMNKPNTWRDLIDVCEDLIAKKYSARARLAIGGRSAGGITVGRAMTERPELFAAVIDGVGWSNPLRYVAEQNGYGEEPEWGAIAEEAGYRALKLIDSYQAVKNGVAYPAVLLTTGVTDPRVGPFHVAKMTARLQAATSSKKPILLRVDFDAGHGVGSTRAQQDREAADTYAFLLWQTGVKGYQPG